MRSTCNAALAAVDFPVSDTTQTGWDELMVDCDEIVATHGHLVWRTAYRLLGRHDDALDCCQEAFLAAYRAASRALVDDWRSFLASLATRRAIDHLRRRARTRNRFSALDGEPEPTASGAARRRIRARSGSASVPGDTSRSAPRWSSCPISLFARKKGCSRCD